MKKFLGSMAALTVIAAAVGLFYASRIASRAAISLADLPQNTVLFALLDARALRERPEGRELLGQLAARRPASCTVDPTSQLDVIALALDAGVGRLGPFNAVVHVRGPLRAEAATACLTSLVQASAPVDLHAHDVMIVAGQPSLGSIAAFASPQVRAVRGGVLIAPASFAPTAFDAAEHRSPGADSNPSIRDGFTALGRAPVLAVVWDAHAPIPITGAPFMGPLMPLSFALGSPTSISFALTPQNQGAHVQFVWHYATDEEATRAQGMLGMLWGQSRGVLTAAATQSEYEFLESLRAIQPRVPALAAPTARLQLAFVPLNAALERAQWRADGSSLRLEFDWSDSELSAVLGGLSAGIETRRILAP